MIDLGQEFTGQTQSLSDAVGQWSPAPVGRDDPLRLEAAANLAAVLGPLAAAPAVLAALPPLWHWVYFLTWPGGDELGADGHPRNGDFLPPLPERRRMVAGGRVHIEQPLELGAPAQRTAELLAAEQKLGHTGELLFVTVGSAISQHGRSAITEEQDLVYRSGSGARQSGSPASSRPAAALSFPVAWQRRLCADPVLLFRFSAVTANAHRIHYDRDYARHVEGYPDLVVHGPLLVLAMAELWRANAAGQHLLSIRYRLRRPVFAGEQVRIVGDGGQPNTRLAVVGPDDTLRAEAWVDAATPGDERRPCASVSQSPRRKGRP